MMHYNVVISGMGVAGLSAAYEAANKNSTVCLVERRDAAFIRVQRIVLEPVSRDYLRSMLHTDKIPSNLAEQQADEKFLRELEEVGVALKDIQGFIWRRLKALPVSKIDYKFHSELTDIDLCKGSAMITSADHPDQKTNINFTYLIGADGVQRHTLNTLMNNPSNPAIECIADPENLHQYGVVDLKRYLLVKIKNITQRINYYHLYCAF